MKRLSLIFICFAITSLCTAQEKSSQVINSNYFKPVAAKNEKPAAAKNEKPAAAASADSVNINEMIQKQIASAQQKQTEQKPKPVVQVKQAVKPQVNKAAVKQPETQKSSMSLNLILFAAGSALILFYFVFRKEIAKIGSKKAKLKNNIKLLREERLIVKTKEKKNNIRTRLVEDTVQMSSKEVSVPVIARERNVSQGEILLAARIKSYEMARVCSNK